LATGTLTIATNAPDSPRTVSLSGTGVAATTLTLPAPGTLASATVGTAYSGAINASGSVTATTNIYNYLWTVNGNQVPTNGTPLTLADGLALFNSGGWTLSIGGTPTVSETKTLTVSVTACTPSPTGCQLTSIAAGPVNYTIVINPAIPLTLPTFTALPGATTNLSYSGAINASGGSGTNYTFTVNGTAVQTNGTPFPIGDGITAWNTGGFTLSIGGTPTLTQTVSFTVSVKDSAGHTVGPNTYTIAVNPPNPLNLPTPDSASLPFGNIGQTYNGSINASGGSGQGYVFTVNGTQIPITNTPTTVSNVGGLTFANSGGNTLFIGGSPTASGNFTLNVSVSDSAGDSAGPVAYSVNVVNPNGYTVSGTVNYNGTQTGWIYLQLTNCNGCDSRLGTAIPAAGSFTIHGVQPGTYNVQAWMDTLGFETPNASNPSTNPLPNVNVTVGFEPVSNLTVTLADPPAVTLGSTSPSISGVSGYSGGAIVSLNNMLQNNNGVETATSYNVRWSASSSFSSVLGSTSFPANGEQSPWLVSGIVGCGSCFFEVQGAIGTTTTNWSSPYGPITIGAPTGGNTVTGTVTLPSNVTPNGPLYVGFYDQNSGNVYMTVIASPSSSTSNAYSLQVPTGTNYFLFGTLDQLNNGLMNTAGNISNTNQSNMVGVAINPSIPSSLTQNLDLTPFAVNSYATLRTNSYESEGEGVSYNIGFKVTGVFKLPVAVEVLSGPNLATPADYASGGFYGYSDFDFWPDYNSTPNIGDTYHLNVTYSDLTSEILTVSVNAVPSAFATLISPADGTAGISTTPNFSWTDPANSSNYSYQFKLLLGEDTIWQIPSKNSGSNGFSNATTSVTWGVDPTGSGDTPSVSSLNGSSTYCWKITATDVNGNSAISDACFHTVSVPLVLAGSLGSGAIGIPYSKSLTASGGSGSGYYFMVNAGSGWQIISNGSAVSLNGADGLMAQMTSFNTLTIFGTPVSVGSAHLVVEVFDSSYDNNTLTYNIPIYQYPPITVSASLGNGIAGTSYSGAFTAGGGSGSGYAYSVAVNGGSSTAVPANGSALTLTDGLSASLSSPNKLLISGTPTSAATISLGIKVKDSSTDIFNSTYSIRIVAAPDGSRNSYLNGTYVCKSDGFQDGDDARWATLSSIVVNGSTGTITSGEWDSTRHNINSAAVAMAGTLTGSFSVGADNNGIMTITSAQTTGGTGTYIGQYAIALNDGGGATTTASEFRAVEIDDVGATPSGQHGTADCYQANTGAFAASTISGNSFVYGTQGEDESGLPEAWVGRFSAANGVLTNAINDGMYIKKTGDGGGSCASNCGTYTAPDAFGRFTTAIPVEIAGQLYTGTSVEYIIDANRAFMMTTAGDGGIQDGDVRTQQQSTYSGANMNGNFVLYWQSYGYQNGSIAGYGISLLQGTGDGAGNFTINQSYDNNNGSFVPGHETGGPIAASFDASNPGRVWFSPDSGSTIYEYFFDNNSAFFLSFNSGSPSSLSTGWIEPQTQTTFTDAALAGNYLLGQLPLMIPTMSGTVREWDFDNAGNITGTQTSGGPATFSYDTAVTGTTYSWLSSTDGTFSAPTSTTGRSCAVISATRAACISNTATTPGVIILQQ
jgi:hypothetical protein